MFILSICHKESLQKRLRGLELLMTGYTKLFGSLITSTIWREDDKTRILWVTMLALKDRRQIVEGSVPGLADMARMSVDDCRKALAKLSEPDPDSRTVENEGRRIRAVDEGWLILNGEKYREKMGLDERREYQRKYQRQYRAKHKQGKPLAGEEAYCRYVEAGGDPDKWINEPNTQH